jgi:hypothetical protein
MDRVTEQLTIFTLGYWLIMIVGLLFGLSVDAFIASIVWVCGLLITYFVARMNH